MTLFAPSDIMAQTIPADGGRGCGVEHRRPTGPDGPVHPWPLQCDACEAWLRENDQRWQPSVQDIVPTFDEARAQERFELQGSKDRDALMLALLARNQGIPQSQLPASVQRMISGLQPHIPVPAQIAGEVECAACGNGQPPGAKFCNECGAPMTGAVPRASLPSGRVA